MDAGSRCQKIKVCKVRKDSPGVVGREQKKVLQGFVQLGMYPRVPTHAPAEDNEESTHVKSTGKAVEIGFDGTKTSSNRQSSDCPCGAFGAE